MSNTNNLGIGTQILNNNAIINNSIINGKNNNIEEGVKIIRKKSDEV